ncbi:MAG: glycosyltransferase family 39 protein [Anaerolineales bacterium]|nr:glycosyltransferase family 39 protein [Anaerolineales bacterium]
MNRSKLVNFIAVGLLGLMFALMVSSARLKSPVMDEQNHIARGYAYLRTGDLRLNLPHPPLVNSLSAAPLLLLPDLKLPTDSPAWERAHTITFATQFLWHANHNADQIVLVARLPIILLAILLGCFVFAWARELHGPLVGLLALGLYVFDPNILAHARLTTTDLGVTCFLFMAVYCFWRWLNHPTWPRLAVAGFTLGLALVSKYSALVLMPILPLIGLAHILISRQGEAREDTTIVQRTWNLAVAVGLMFALAGLVVWAVYGFEVGPLTEGGIPVPIPTYIRGLQGVFRHLDRGHLAFLHGDYFTTARWDFFPVAFAIKTPLPTLILLCLSVGWMVKQRAWRSAYPLLLPVLIYLAISLSSKSLNIGYRHILPLLPFLFVFASGVARSQAWGESLRIEPRHLPGAAACLLLAVWYLVGSVRIYPDYLAYFNELVGGPDNGWHYLVDSNLDWGQDLKGLERYMERAGIEEVYLSWFGSTYPDAYGYDIPHRLLPSYVYYPGQVTGVTFNPLRPAPGVYAISATNLQGVYFSDHDLFAWFRERQPLAKIGYSIFIYEVGGEEAGATGSVVCLSDVSLDELDAEARALTVEREAIRLIRFDHRTGFLLPSEGQEVSYVVPDAFPFSSTLQQRFQQDSELLHVAEDRSYAVYRLASRDALAEKLASVQQSSAVYWSPAVEFVPGDPQEWRHPLAPPVNFNHQVVLLGYEYVPAKPGTIELLTYWQVLELTEPPLAIFVHLLDAHSTVMGAYDGLSISPASWEPGDVFIQWHTLSVEPTAPAGEYQVELGFYSPATMQRLPIFQEGQAIADRLLLSPIQVQGR